MQKKITIKYQPPGDLKPNPYNPRAHTDGQIEQIRRSIREFGFVSPVLVVNKVDILAGHGCTLAAVEEGIEQIPTVDVSDLTPEQRLAYLVADNRLAENSSWDNDMLEEVMRELTDLEIDLELTGFYDQELSALFGHETPPPEDVKNKEKPLTLSECPKCGFEF